MLMWHEILIWQVGTTLRIPVTTAATIRLAKGSNAAFMWRHRRDIASFAYYVTICFYLVFIGIQRHWPAVSLREYQRIAAAATVEPVPPCIFSGCMVSANSCTRFAASASSFRFSSRWMHCMNIPWANKESTTAGMRKAQSRYSFSVFASHAETIPATCASRSL